MCNEKFFPASLPFHLKQCEKRRAARIVPCPYCKTDVIQLDLPDHIKRCPKGAGARTASSGGSGQQKASSMPHGSGNGGASCCEAGAANGQFEPEVLDDGRMRCVYCGRFFTPDRIDHHQDICGKLKTARPKGVDGVPTQTGRRVFNAEAQRLGQGAAFLTPEKYKKRQAERISEARATKGGTPKWRRESEEFQEAVRAGRGDGNSHAPSAPRRPATGGPGPGKVTCPYCNRHFDENAADRHIPICAKIINRPKPPPRGDDSPRPEESPRPRTGERDPRRASAPRQQPARGGSPTPSRGHDSSAGSPGGGGQNGRSASADYLPGLPGSPPQSLNSTGSGFSGARDLNRQKDSSNKLPSLKGPQQPSASSTGGSTASPGLPRRPPRAPKQHLAPDVSEEDHDQTMLPGSRTSEVSDEYEEEPAPSRGRTIVERVGMRRCAMMYRLLSHVPRDALERELIDCGVQAGEMDQEGMIEAILKELA